MRKKHVATTSDSISASYDVYIADPSMGTTYTSLVAQLNAAVSGTTFTSLLATYSTVYSTPAFANATSTIASTSDTTVVVASSNDDPAVSTGAIIGIVIGAFAFIICILGIFLYCTSMKAKPVVHTD